MKSQANQTRKIIENAGIATFANDLFVGEEPTDPDNVITVYDTGGEPPDEAGAADNPSVMIRIRNNNYLGGFEKASDIKDLLWFNNSHFDLNGVRLIYFLLGDINSLGKDSNGRYVFTINFRIKREVIN